MTDVNVLYVDVAPLDQGKVDKWLIGIIDSMNKSSNSGHIYLADGTRVHYKIKSDWPDQFYPLFSHDGPVRVRCVANFDDTLKPTSVDIYEIIPV